jgi:hypothetical protein
LLQSLEINEVEMRYVWLVLCFLVAVISVFIGRSLGLSPAANVALTGIATSLAMFPFMKRWMPKTSFGLWALATAIGAAVGWLLYLGFSRFGG